VEAPYGSPAVPQGHLITNINEESKEVEPPSPGMSGRQMRVDWQQYEPNFLFNELSEDQDRRVRAASPYGNLRTWKLARLIVKSGDDLRLEQFAMQLISMMDQIFKRKKLNLWLFPYEILSTGFDCGLIEFVKDGLSLDQIGRVMKERYNKNCDLYDYFRINYGKPDSEAYRKA
jgi:hypothetical protein